MNDITDVTKRIEALRLGREHYRTALAEPLELVELKPEAWLVSIKEGDKVIAEGPVGATGVHMLRAMLGGLSAWDVAGGAGCSDRVGCAAIGQFGNKCFYLCNTVALHH
jgi:hypothetical protein